MRIRFQTPIYRTATHESTHEKSRLAAAFLMHTFAIYIALPVVHSLQLDLCVTIS